MRLLIADFGLRICGVLLRVEFALRGACVRVLLEQLSGVCRRLEDCDYFSPNAASHISIATQAGGSGAALDSFRRGGVLAAGPQAGVTRFLSACGAVHRRVSEAGRGRVDLFSGQSTSTKH